MSDILLAVSQLSDLLNRIFTPVPSPADSPQVKNKWQLPGQIGLDFFLDKEENICHEDVRLVP